MRLLWHYGGGQLSGTIVPGGGGAYEGLGQSPVSVDGRAISLLHG